MWRNFKISSKLLLGFGLLLLVFVTAVVVTWRSLVVVREGSDELAQTIVAVMQDISTLERDTYELLLVFRQAMSDHTEENLTALRAREAVVQKDIDAILAFGAANPALQSPKYIQDKFVGPYKNFVDTFHKAIDATRKRNEIDLVLAAQGQAIFNDASELTASFVKAALDSAATLDANRITERVDRLQRSVSVLSDVQSLRREIQRAWVTNDFRTMNEALQKFPIPALEKELIDMRDTGRDSARVALMDKLIKALPVYAANLKDFVQAHGVLEEQIRLCNSLVEVVNSESSNAADLARDRVESISLESVADLTSAITILFISAAAAVVLGLSIAILISRSISRPLNTIVVLARRAGEGDLTVERKEFCYEGRDELGVLADVISSMIVSQEESMQRVVDVADNLSASAGNLSSISEETNASMEEVKASIDHVSNLSESNGAALEQCNAGVEEMSAGADTAAQSANDSAAFISQTAKVSNKAIQTVNGVISGMRDVDVNAKESESKTRQLVTSVENVSSFVSVITGIADQTNLLALNAAIEAARAGEVGRGFAVVAEEVRKLAEESARAAQSVNGIIVELQGSAQESIKATVEASRVLAETLSQAEKAQTELNGVLSEMDKANDSIQSIASVAKEQAASSREVAMAIDSATKSTMEMVETISSIRRATDETAQSAQGVAEQSEAMNEHAQTLLEVLSNFKLDSAAQPASAPKALKKSKR
jgi:methyl-accepting chemotaxis protein